MRLRRLLASALGAAALLLACAGGRSGTEDAAALAKVHLDLAAINADGLTGPADGLRAVSYEFCIPATEAAVAEVTAIDRTVAVQRGARGRIGCRADQFLCLGHTHQPDFRNVLLGIARLEYVAAIEPFFGE